MPFATTLNGYFESLACTNKEVASRCGISASSISRYRTGGRTPEIGGKSIRRLADGLASLYLEKGLSPAPSPAQIEVELEESIFAERQQGFDFCERIDQLMSMLEIRNNELAGALEIDPSYLSRIRSKQRIPSDQRGLARKFARYASSKRRNANRADEAAKLVGCNSMDSSDFAAAIESWLAG